MTEISLKRRTSSKQPTNRTRDNSGNYGFLTWSRSTVNANGRIRKALYQGSCMPKINSIINNSEDTDVTREKRLGFYVTDGLTRQMKSNEASVEDNEVILTKVISQLFKNVIRYVSNPRKVLIYILFLHGLTFSSVNLFKLFPQNNNAINHLNTTILSNDLQAWHQIML